MKRPKQLVSSTPDLRVDTIDFNNDSFLILASDGIWDPLEDQMAVDVVQSVLLKDSVDSRAQKVSVLRMCV